jgi:hypothetical protein
MAALQIFRSKRAARWTKETVNALGTAEVRQLRDNALRLAEPEIAALCDEVLGARPRGRGPQRRRKSKDAARRLVSRSAAFGLRGVHLQDARWSRGGVRARDGEVVFALWADDVVAAGGGCRCLLWAPNLDGKRPWSDKPGGQERLEHCRRALERGHAEGLLVYGQSAEGSLPEDKAISVDGADPDTVLALRIEKCAGEYWASWGGKAAAQG